MNRPTNLAWHLFKSNGQARSAEQSGDNAGRLRPLGVPPLFQVETGFRRGLTVRGAFPLK